MRVLADPRRGYDHAAAYYRSEEELLAIAVPFACGGPPGEPVVVSLARDAAERLAAELPASANTTFLASDDHYLRPAVAVKDYRELMSALVAGGARQIRIIGEIPAPALGAGWDWWARYEAAINHIFDEFPLTSVCAYDTRVVPRAVLDDVARTHPLVATADGMRPGSAYVEPSVFLGEPRPAGPLPVQHRPPAAVLVDPTPGAARSALHAVNRSALPAADVYNLSLALSEAVTNAGSHGTPPVHVRIWGDERHLVASVHDAGPGPGDPFVGLLPAPDRVVGGLGLWIAHQVCDHVALHRDADGFTIRLTMGDAHPRP